MGGSVVLAVLWLPVVLVNRINGRRRVMSPVLKIGLTPIVNGVNPISAIQSLQTVPKIAVNVGQVVVD